MNTRLFLFSLVSLVTVAAPAAAEFSASGFLATDLPSRGIALSNGEPMLGASLGWDHSSGLFLGAEGFTAEEGPVPDRSRGMRAFVGYFHVLEQDQALELSLSHTEFSGNFPSSWDYSEARVDLHLSRELSLTTAYSPDLQGRDVRSMALAVNWRPSLGERAFLVLSGGGTWLGDDEDAMIKFAEVGAGMSFGKLEIQLMHHLVDNRTVRLFHVDGRNATTLRFDYRLW